MYFLTIISALLITHHTIALSIRAPLEQDTTIVQWTIPRLNMHMMSQQTGLPGNEWPSGSYFDTTIDFDVVMPGLPLNLHQGDLKANCKGSFPNGTLPLNPIKCTPPSYTEDLWFSMSPYTALGPRRLELSFILNITCVIKEFGLWKGLLLTGSTPITANDPKEPTSYLTCLSGAPMDGLRCSINSFMSVKKDLVIYAKKILIPQK